MVILSCLQAGLQHEFLIFQVCKPEDATFWIRVERSPREQARRTEGWRRAWRGSPSIAEAKDTIKICSNRSALFPAASSTSQPYTLVRLQYDEADAPHLKQLCALLNSIAYAYPDCGLPEGQCYWFCSSIIEIIRGNFPRGLFLQDLEFDDRERYGTLSVSQAQDTRNGIYHQFREWLAQIGMSVDIWVFCEMKYLSSRP